LVNFDAVAFENDRIGLDIIIKARGGIENLGFEGRLRESLILYEKSSLNMLLMWIPLLTVLGWTNFGESGNPPWTVGNLYHQRTLLSFHMRQ
jgi:hypothetical protein